MSNIKEAPHGSWASPITSDVITQATVRLAQPAIDGDCSYWLEGRPYEKGRTVLVKRPHGGQSVDVTPEPFNVRTLAHEYGGGAYTVKHGVIYFISFSDQRIYEIKNEKTRAVTAEGAYHYADICVDTARGRLICVREDHTVKGHEARTEIVSIDIESGKQSVLLTGNDFYSSPGLSPDGKRLTWLTWSHPNMPWDESQVYVGDVDGDGTIKGARLVAGGKDESCFQPQWSPQGELFFISDRTGFWNFYRGDRSPLLVLERKTDFGIPQWIFGMSTYDFLNDGRILCAYGDDGVSKLAFLDGERGTLSAIDNQWQDFGNIRCASGKAIFLGGSSTLMPAVVEMDAGGTTFEVLRKSSPLEIDAGYISTAQPIKFPTEGGKEAYAFFYPPRNKDFSAPAGELPPLIVKSHGGPTSATSSTLSLGIQYWTSRGFAVVDVNYGGSTGFGREYRNRLYDSWGVVDVDDCVNAAKYLANQGKVDAKRMAITGGSAGGYTTLCALTFRDVFQAGTSSYGVSDLEALAKDTHKFESRYLDRLVGPYPQAKDIYIARSPVNFAQKIKCPVLFLQGLEDKVVPPSQSETMVNALRKNGIPVAYIEFEGEQHGWRKAETIKRALDAELFFYGEIFGFKPAGALEPVKIDNWHVPVKN
ncbi:MAG: S9 family peptidase [Candidatus Obscuribacterales bacterium]